MTKVRLAVPPKKRVAAGINRFNDFVKRNEAAYSRGEVIHGKKDTQQSTVTGRLLSAAAVSMPVRRKNGKTE